MINVGVIGAGYWGPNLVRNFAEIEDTLVSMCCDKRQERLDFINKRYPSIKTTTDYNEMIEDPNIDAIAIATHGETHYDLAKQALGKGKHVFVEKPMTMKGHESLELHKIAADKKLTLMVGHILLYAGPVEYIKKAIEDGEIGEIFYLDSARVNLQPFREDINVIWDLGPHDISLAMFLLDKDPVSTRVIGGNYISDNQENIAFGVLKFPGNVLSHFHLSWLAPMKMRQTIIVGSKKMIVYDDVDALSKVKIYDKGVDISSDPTGLTERQLTCRKGHMFCPKLDDREPLMKEVKHFIECINTGKAPRSNGINGWKVVKVLEAMQESVRSGGQEVSINFNS